MTEKALFALAGALLAILFGISGIAYLLGSRRPAPAAPPAQQAAARADTPVAAPVCRVVGDPIRLPEGLEESSGVAVSGTHGGIAWTHNDSGDPILHAVDGHGRAVGAVRLTGATVTDWEDLAVGPCPEGGDCLFVADIGDNGRERASVTVFRVPEPAPGDASAAATAIPLRYPDGPHDAEALFLLDGVLHVVTKGEGGSSAVYRHAGGERLQRLRVLSAVELKRRERLTGAAASRDGRWVALRTLDEVRLYPAASLAGPGAIAPAVVDLRPLEEEQGEAVAFTPDGHLVLTSEAGDGDAATLARLNCTLP